MKGAVAAGHRLTAEAGARILAEGGNAVDACIGAALVSWVAESPLTGPGGAGFMLVHRARDGRNVLLDFFAAVPGMGLAAEDIPAMEPVDIPFGSGNTTQSFLIGAASCAVPGTVAGLAAAHRLYGTVPWPAVFEPAIELARVGVTLNDSQALLHTVLEPVLRHDPDGRVVYGLRGPVRTGDRVVMRDLAGTLEQLATEGPDAFYRGELGRRTAVSVAERGGRLTERDLASYRVTNRRPVRAAYRGHEVVSNPPPSAGGLLVAYALRLLDELGPGGGEGSAEALARLAEVAREATRARAGGFVSGLQRGGLPRALLAQGTVEAAVARIRSRERLARDTARARLPSTTHVSVLDAPGNAASLSCSTGCGSGVFVPGTGIHLNNMLGEVDLNPKGAPARPGLRLTSMMAPSVVLRDGRARLVVGSAGSERLREAILQTIVNVIDHGLPLDEAIERPRIHLDGDDLHCEAGIDAGQASRLEELGYGLVRWPGTERNLFFGGVAAVGIRADRRLEAAGDLRRGGHGIVVER